jgi:general secretion pathway protein E
VTGPAETIRADRQERLAELLLQSGQCDALTIDRARRVAQETRQRIDKVLLQLGLIGERALAEAYAALLGTALAAPGRYPDEPLFPDNLKDRFLRGVRAMPVALEHDRVVIAAADPLDPFVAPAIAAAIGRPVALEVAVPIELDAAFDRLYPESDANAPEVVEGSTAPLEEDTERLKDLASEAPVIRLVNQIISRAVETRASDVHIEPLEDRLRVRYNYDGVLHEIEVLPARLAPAIISRIKIVAALDIAERRLPQDGRIKLAVRGQDVDLRISTIPSLYGESVAVRVLDRSAVEFDFGKLGLSAQVMQRLKTAIALPNGLVLVTGPTGSGKTTTLYTALLSLNSVTRKIITVEDPVEYRLPGITQTEIKPQIGLSFAALLRSMLRQNPHIIMVGEMRDLETAQIAVQAALTGHLVLSTAHTNSAAATITRLRDMGLEDYLQAAVLRGVLAQRLVRKLCPACRREADAPPELVARFRLDRRNPGARVTLFHPVGCAACRGTGYRGRRAIAEFLVPDDDVNRLFFARAPDAELERAAVAAGMTPMFEAGIDAALAGDTTIEEVARSIRADT